MLPSSTVDNLVLWAIRWATRRAPTTLRQGCHFCGKSYPSPSTPASADALVGPEGPTSCCRPRGRQGVAVSTPITGFMRTSLSPRPRRTSRLNVPLHNKDCRKILDLPWQRGSHRTFSQRRSLCNYNVSSDDHCRVDRCSGLPFVQFLHDRHAFASHGGLRSSRDPEERHWHKPESTR